MTAPETGELQKTTWPPPRGSRPGSAEGRLLAGGCSRALEHNRTGRRAQAADGREEPDAAAADRRRAREEPAAADAADADAEDVSHVR